MKNFGGVFLVFPLIAACGGGNAQSQTTCPEPPAPQAVAGDVVDEPSSSPPLVRGAYQLVRIESPDGVQELPESLLVQMEGAYGFRWLWIFDEDMAHISMALAAEPIRDTHGSDSICEVRLDTEIRWERDGFVVPSSSRAFGQVTSIAFERRSEPRELEHGGRLISDIHTSSDEDHCSVSLARSTQRITDIVRGDAPDRPRSFVAVSADGLRRLSFVAEEEVEIDWEARARQHFEDRLTGAGQP
jgi:hypothetical protein